MKTKHPALIVLENLLMGGEIVVGGEHYSLQQTEKGDFVTAVKRKRQLYEKGTLVSEEDVYLYADVSLSWFIRECRNLTEADVKNRR